MERQRMIRYAENDDYSWLKNHDKNISENKIENKEVYIVEEGGQIIGWLLSCKHLTVTRY